MLPPQLSIAPDLAPDYVKAIASFIQLTKVPNDFNALYDLDEVLRKTELSYISCEYLKSQPEVAQLIDERYQAPIPSIADLLSYPENSLAYVFGSHLRANNFELEFYRQREFKDDISYITLRRSRTHDIHHIITGFNTDLAGEVGLQAFELAQMRSPLAVAVISSALVHTFNNPVDLGQVMSLIQQGWNMGLKAKCLFAQRWEENWAKPLDDWRQELGVEPSEAYLNLSFQE